MGIERDRGMRISTLLLIKAIIQAGIRNEQQEIVYFHVGGERQFVSNDEAIEILQAKLDAGIEWIETG